MSESPRYPLTGRFGRPEPRLHNIPVPSTEEGRRIVDIIRDIKIRGPQFNFDYSKLERGR